MGKNPKLNIPNHSDNTERLQIPSMEVQVSYTDRDRELHRMYSSSSTHSVKQDEDTKLIRPNVFKRPSTWIITIIILCFLICVPVIASYFAQISERSRKTSVIIEEKGPQAMNKFCKEVESGYYPNLEVLDASNCEMKDLGFLCLANLLREDRIHNLKELYLTNNLLTDYSTSALFAIINQGMIPSLHTLHLASNTLGTGAMNGMSIALKNNYMKYIEEINFSNTKISDESFQYVLDILNNVENQYYLKNFFLNDIPLSNSSFISFFNQTSIYSLYPSLETLSLSGDSLSEDSLQLLSQMITNKSLPKLNTLFLERVDVNDTLFNSFKQALDTRDYEICVYITNNKYCNKPTKKVPSP
ncbi:hypothetical protein WA158_003845 [Blastocystis sp. Blastoise]